MHTGQSYRFKIPHRIHHADGVAVALFHIGDDRHVDRFHDVAGNHQPLGLGHQRQIGLAEKGRLGGIAADVDRVEARSLHQDRRERIVRANGDRHLTVVDQLLQLRRASDFESLLKTRGESEEIR